MSAFVPPGDCPNCGESVPEGAAACPHCGADERAGWNVETYLDGIDLPEEDNGEFRRQVERASAGGAPRGGRAWLTLTLVVLLVLVLSGAWWWWR